MFFGFFFYHISDFFPKEKKMLPCHAIHANKYRILAAKLMYFTTAFIKHFTLVCFVVYLCIIAPETAL